MAVAVAVLLALVVHKVVEFIEVERKRVHYRMMAIIGHTMAVEKQRNNRHYHLIQQILLRPLWRQ